MKNPGPCEPGFRVSQTTPSLLLLAAEREHRAADEEQETRGRLRDVAAAASRAKLDIPEDVALVGLENVEVKTLDGLLVDFCRKENVSVVIRGVRVYSDFEYEFQMALTNRRMAPEIETLFMMPSENLAYVTASTVREIASYGGDTAAFVTSAVQKRLLAAVKA